MAETKDEKIARRVKTEKLLKDPNLADDIIAHVSSGGSLIELCEMWGVQFHVINTWIYTNNKTQYEQAIISSNEFLIQTVRSELKALATVDLREAYDEQGKLKAPKDWPKSLAKVIASVESFEEYSGSGKDREYIGDTRKLKLWDKLKALELLGKNLSMFVDKHEITGRVTLEDLVNASTQDSSAAERGS